jgi:hypothetical protein
MQRRDSKWPTYLEDVLNGRKSFPFLNIRQDVYAPGFIPGLRLGRKTHE